MDDDESGLRELAEELYRNINRAGFRGMHRRQLPRGERVDAALGALLAQGRLEAWQRGASFHYTALESAIDPMLDLLRASNPELLEEAAKNPAVEVAALEWMTQNREQFEGGVIISTQEGVSSTNFKFKFKPLPATMPAARWPDGLDFRAQISAGRAESVPKLEAVYDEHGNVYVRPKQ